MDKPKRKHLEKKGWKVGRVEEFLDLSPQELAFIEVKLALSDKVKALRKKRRMTQLGAARLLGSSQSRIAKIESGDPSVSLDLLVRSAISLGATREDLAKTIRLK